MVRNFVFWSFILFGSYLALSHATEGGTLLLDADKAAVDYGHLLQGR